MTYPPPGRPPGLPPRVDPRELRPRRAWYGVAAAVVVVGVVVGVAGFLIGLYSVLNSFPQRMDAEFTGGSTAVVQLSAGRQAEIYLVNPDAPERVEVQCRGEPVDGGKIKLAPFSETSTFLAGGRRWQLIYRVTVTESGDYELRCTSTDPVAAEGRFGVTDDVDPEAVAARTFGSLLALIGAPCAALFAGGVIALLTALRRSAHRKRLARERTGPYPAAPHPGMPPPG